MRVIGGVDRGRTLAAPRGRGTRPTADRVREALFDILGPRIIGTRVLDLFAGTGAVGIEALSRGAAYAVFVESDREALRALRRNLATLGLPGTRAQIVAGDARDALAAIACSEPAFDLVFLDPPYAGSLVPPVLAALAASPLVRPGADVVVQHRVKTPVPTVPGLSPAREPRRYGETALTFLLAEGYTRAGSSSELHTPGVRRTSTAPRA